MSLSWYTVDVLSGPRSPWYKLVISLGIGLYARVNESALVALAKSVTPRAYRLLKEKRACN